MLKLQVARRHVPVGEEIPCRNPNAVREVVLVDDLERERLEQRALERRGHALGMVRRNDLQLARKRVIEIHDAPAASRARVIIDVPVIANISPRMSAIQ